MGSNSNEAPSQNKRGPLDKDKVLSDDETGKGMEGHRSKKDNQEQPNESQFIKAAIRKSHDCAKYMRICANF